jgi:hypothetical protein
LRRAVFVIRSTRTRYDVAHRFEAGGSSARIAALRATVSENSRMTIPNADAIPPLARYRAIPFPLKNRSAPGCSGRLFTISSARPARATSIAITAGVAISFARASHPRPATLNMCTSSGYTEKTPAMFLMERAELDAIERIDAMSFLQKREVGLTRADEQDVRHRSR